MQTRFDLALISLHCDKKESHILRDNVYGSFCFVSLDPASPGIKGFVKFDAGKMARLQTVSFGAQEIMRNLTMPPKQEYRWIAGVIMEKDREKSQIVQTKLRDAINNLLPSIVGRNLSIGQLQIMMRLEVRRLMRAERKWLKNDDDVIGFPTIFIKDADIAKTETVPAIIAQTVAGMANTTGATAYTVQFALSKH